MARWGLFVEESLGMGRDSRIWDVSLIAEVEGTHEEALAALWEWVQSFRPRHPAFVRRQRLYRQRDGFIGFYEGATSDFACRFSVGNLVQDSALEKKASR